ncbi:methylmalonic aciduria and homocystinuria type D protein [Chroococcidiopsis sp. CCMEE 29]|uniref:methylmalonic aciduria and homocystinuria type D protein n=1 Tax=Chroococcidiopsis sp. CCMEE 29 TaxID=155894 RepID=UPI0020209590|nr:methylmalonic aciduria and homocystinuria type D protein [Chroococcidiopsis sp. CCMEE 29]
MQYSVHSPTEFISTHLEQLLPSWSVPVWSVLVVLQLCQFALIERTAETENYKDQLRQQFIDFGNHVVSKLRAMGYLADMFDPCTGWPLNSPPGQLRLDDVAVVRSILGYSVVNCGLCMTLVHPTWGKAVYPSTLMSSAPPHVLKEVVNSILVGNKAHLDGSDFVTGECCLQSPPYLLTSQLPATPSRNTTTPARDGAVLPSRV